MSTSLMQAYFNRTSPFIFKTLGEIRSNHLTPKNKLAQKRTCSKVDQALNDQLLFFSQQNYFCKFAKWPMTLDRISPSIILVVFLFIV